MPGRNPDENLEPHLRRFQAEHPDGSPEEFQEWLASHEHELADGGLESFASEILGRLDEPAGDEPSTNALAPRPVDVPSSSAPPTSHFRVGATVGSYVLESYLGAGASGQVWVAHDQELARLVALKLLLPERSDERALELFAREARSGGRLQHPNLVATWAYGTDDGTSWIAQELVPDAWTLADAIEHRRREDAVESSWYIDVAKLVASIADGLHAAHEAGVVHRDVKPRNILIGADGIPRVADFGLARLDDEATLSRSGRVVGTWAYMSPEQVRAERGTVDRRADVFSLGVVLYELLTLLRPFEGDTVQQTAEKILGEEPPPPSELRSGCPRPLSTVCLRAIEKERERRYSSADELAADLRRWLAGEAVLAREPTPFERLQRWTRAHRTLATATVVGLVGIITIGILWMRELGVARAISASIAERDEAMLAVTAERNAVFRLSARVELDELVERQRSLWPPYPNQLADLHAWRDDAERLIRELPTHRAHLEALEAEGAVQLGEAVEGDRKTWWSGRLVELIAGLEALRDGLAAPTAIVPLEGWSVPKRIAFAEQLEADFGAGGKHRSAWDAALPRLAEAYPDLDVQPCVGLVPLGPDPRSGLWEFAHVASGDVPTRDADGTLELSESTAAVLVWIPGGRSWMGMQRDDPDGPNYHAEAPDFMPARPPREITLSPFAIGKYELTKGQWLRCSGQLPSNTDEDPSLLDPVGYISWSETLRVLERFDLSLPTDAQWEHACRAGSAAPFAFGTLEDSKGRFNCVDQTARASGAAFGGQEAALVLDDGFAYAAPVGSLPPNDFGLHEMHGNLWELVLDGAAYGPYAEHESSVDPFTPIEDAVPDPDERITRGGDFTTPWIACCSYVRMGYSSEGRGGSLGIRIGRGIETAGASR